MTDIGRLTVVELPSIFRTARLKWLEARDTELAVWTDFETSAVADIMSAARSLAFVTFPLTSVRSGEFFAVKSESVPGLKLLENLSAGECVPSYTFTTSPDDALDIFTLTWPRAQSLNLFSLGHERENQSEQAESFTPLAVSWKSQDEQSAALEF